MNNGNQSGAMVPVGDLEMVPGTSFAESMRWAEIFATSGMFSDVKGAAQCMVKIAAGAEIGMAPFASMSGIHIINGKTAIGAGLMAAAIKRSRRYTYKVVRSDNAGCDLTFYQAGGGTWSEIGESSFALEDAKRAGLTNNPVWGKYPKAMCFNRALAAGARMYCPDVFGGPVYDPEELEAIDEAGNPMPPVSTDERRTVRNVTAETISDSAPAAVSGKEAKRLFESKANAMGFTGELMRLGSMLLGYLPSKWTAALLTEALNKPESQWRAAINQIEPPLSEPNPVDDAFNEDVDEPADALNLGVEAAPVAAGLPGAFAR